MKSRSEHCRRAWYHCHPLRLPATVCVAHTRAATAVCTTDLTGAEAHVLVCVVCCAHNRQVVEEVMGLLKEGQPIPEHLLPPPPPPKEDKKAKGGKDAAGSSKGSKKT